MRHELLLSGDRLREPLRAQLTARPVVLVSPASGTASAVLVPLVGARGRSAPLARAALLELAAP